MKKVKSWLDNDFDFGNEDKGGGEVEAHLLRNSSFDKGRLDQKKRARDDNRSSTSFNARSIFQLRQGQQRKDNMQLWSSQHAPTSTAALAVHPKKIEEVRHWITSHKSGILLLTGPPGCGKTATVKAIAKEMCLDIQEYKEYSEISRFHSPNSFDLGEINFKIPDDTVPYISQRKSFSNFLFQAQRYKVLSGLEETSQTNAKFKGKLIILEELPGFAYKNTSDFFQILDSYKDSKKSFPLILIQSDSKKSNQKPMFSDEIANRLKLDTVSFNPISPTNMVKALKVIASTESNARSFPMPDRDVFESLAESSGGDIRGAINALQFACTKGETNLRSCVASSGIRTSSTKRARSSATSNRKPLSVYGDQSLPKVGGKEPILDMFHAIGKVLYCKREGELENSNSEVLPLSKRRSPLVSKPEEILSNLPMSEETFAGFLHKNYPSFFTSMRDLAGASEDLSRSEAFFNEWTIGGKISLSEYGGLMAVRGLCYHNTQVSKAFKMRTFHAPDFYQNNRVTRTRFETLDGLRLASRCCGREIYELYGPMIGKFFPHFEKNDVQNAVNFDGLSRPVIPHANQEEMMAVQKEMEADDDAFLLDEPDFVIEDSE